MQSTLLPPNRKAILSWLWLCLLLVALMVVVGGLTRLTESGLSMVEWKPTTLLPPLTETEWQEEFRKYRQSPQYLKVNHGMTLSGFQEIFWLEYVHRLLGRLVGLVFLVPYLFFLARKMLPPPLAFKLAGIFLLGGFQGVIGWYMVKSGLVDQPWVSPVRLALHLGLAFLLFGLILWQILTLQEKHSVRIREQNLWMSAVVLLYLQILLGALVAGLDAGLLYDSFPDMNGEWVPGGLWLLEPWYANLIENAVTVHFLHRLGALIVTAILLFLGLRHRRGWLLGALVLQVLLGALTVTQGVPILLASAHQAGALLLFGLTLRQAFRISH